MCAADGHDLHRVEEVLVAAAADANDDQNQKARSSELPCGQMQHGHYEWRFALKRSVSVCVCVCVCLFVCLFVCLCVRLRPEPHRKAPAVTTRATKWNVKGLI